MHFWLVCAGGAIGAGARYLVNASAMHWMGPGFPWGTFAVNVAGSLVMGLLAGWVIIRGGMSESVRFFLMTGVLGGFTTFSAYALDTFYMVERGAYGLALVYVVGSVLLSIGAVFAGVQAIRIALG
jgi:CrcB protein